jgi:outer membrane protein TolC
LTDAQANVRAQTLALIQLMNPEAAQRWQLTFAPVDRADVAPAETDPEISERLALQYRPELAQARLDAANAELSVIKARNDVLPDLDLVGSYGRIDRGDTTGGAVQHLDGAEFENYSIGLQLQTPILNRAEKARRRRAELASTQSQRAVANLELGVATQSRQAVVEVEKQWQRITAAQEAVRSRTEQLRVAQGRFEVGKTTNLDLLIVQRDFLQAEIDEVSARVRYIQALTGLYAAEGTLLERRGVKTDEWPESPSESGTE